MSDILFATLFGIGLFAILYCVGLICYWQGNRDGYAQGFTDWENIVPSRQIKKGGNKNANKRTQIGTN